MPGRKLAANVYVDGVLHPAGSTPPKDAADRITNPKAWPGKGAPDDDTEPEPAEVEADSASSKNKN